MTSISPNFGRAAGGLPIVRVAAVRTCVFPRRMREDPRELRVRTEQTTVVGRAACRGRASGLTLESVNFLRYPYDYSLI